MNQTLWGLFVVVFASTAVVPGPNVAFSVAQALNYGFQRALPAAIGFALGTGCHALVVLSGVGLLAREYSVVLIVLKWAGVAYLIYLAIKAFSPKSDLALGVAPPTSSARLVLGAILVSFTNPKGLLASLLIYPAFVDPTLPYVSQSLVLGLTAMAISLAVYVGYMLIAARAQRLFKSRGTMSKVVGLLYVGVAVALALKG